MPRTPLIWLLTLAAVAVLSAPVRGEEPRLVGQLVGSRGDLLVGGWRVEATLVTGDPARGRLPVVRYGAPDPRAGTFTISAVGARRASLRALHASGLESRRVELDLAGAAGEVPVTLAYDGPDPETSIVVTASVTGGIGAPALDPARAHVVRSDGAAVACELLACPWMDLEGAWVARGLRPGAYSVEYRDPRFRRAAVTGVATGSSTALRLSGDAGLRLELAGSTWGRDAFGVALSRAGSARREVVRLPTAGAEEPGLALEGLFPGDHVLELVFADRPARRIELAALVAGERRRVTVSLPPPVVVEGRVSAPDGAPLDGLSVRLHGPRDADSERLRRFMGVDAARDPESTTDRGGRFVLPAADPALARMTVGDRSDASVTVDVDLTAPRTVTLKGLGVLRLERVRAVPGSRPR